MKTMIRMFVMVSWITIWGCGGVKHPIMESVSTPATTATTAATTTATTAAQGPSPVVEAYLEYPGPHSKWAGPKTLMLHIQLKGELGASYTLTPALAKPKVDEQLVPPEVLMRKPAGLSQNIPNHDQLARDMMKTLVENMDLSTPEVPGCMYPVKLRLVRSNGEVTEKTGCRGELGWTQAASQIMNTALNREMKKI